MPRASTGASIKAKTFLASSAGYQPGGKMSIVDRSTGSVLLPPVRRIVVDSGAGNRQFGQARNVRLDPLLNR